MTVRWGERGVKMTNKVDEELSDDFSYIVRLRNTDLDGLKRLSTALTSINGLVPVHQQQFVDFLAYLQIN